MLIIYFAFPIFWLCCNFASAIHDSVKKKTHNKYKHDSYCVLNSNDSISDRVSLTHFSVIVEMSAKCLPMMQIKSSNNNLIPLASKPSEFEHLIGVIRLIHHIALNAL